MTTNKEQSQQEKNETFGLPQVEFKPIAARGRQWFKVTAMIVSMVLTVGAGVVYWFFYNPPTTGTAKEIASATKKHENEVLGSSTDSVHHSVPSEEQDRVDEQEAGMPKLTTELKAASEVDGNTKNISPTHTASLHKGTIINVNAPQGYYYIVLSSFIDEDLAMDYAHRLTQEGVEVALLIPPAGRYYFRVAIKQGRIFREANEKAETLKTVYGPDIWIMKY